MIDFRAEMNKNVADNTVAINGFVIGKVTDDVASLGLDTEEKSEYYKVKNDIYTTKKNNDGNDKSLVMQDIIKRVLDKNGIQIKNDILVIYNIKNIKLDVPIGEYDFNNFSRIYIILNE